MSEASNQRSACELQKQALIALRSAVGGVMREHIRLGLPIHIWRDGKVVEISPDEVSKRYLFEPVR